MGASVEAVQTRGRTILVVDDEASIRVTVEGVLSDAGFTVISAASGEEALHEIERALPDLILLDIWMPGLDGFETLARIRELAPDLPVIMVSGHATISTAVHASRQGAVDFLEKPIELSTLLSSVTNAFQEIDQRPGSAVVEKVATKVSSKAARSKETIYPISPVATASEAIERLQVVFNQQKFRGQARQQRTLKSSALMYGRGLHSGQKSGLILEPLPANSGIHFVGVSDRQAVPAHVDYVESTGFATRLKLGPVQVSTVEHLMSALCAYGISNLLIKCNAEVPVMDGSAREFCALIEATGVVEQEGEWYDIAVPTEIRVGDEKEFIQLSPGEGLEIDYTLQYPEPLGTQTINFKLDSTESYREEISSARTFGLVKDIGALQRAGLAQGGRFDNFVLYGEDGPINSALRYQNEAVRHKVLDAIGDLYLLGRRLQGKITARMTGHSDNIALIGRIKELMDQI